MTIRVIGKWTLSVTLLTGLVYSALALSTHTAHASSCDCVEEEFDAHSYCQQHYGNFDLETFVCPIPGYNEYGFVCKYDPQGLFRVFPCD